MPLEQFCVGPGQTALQPAELLVALRLPPPPPRAGALYIKHSPRSTMDIATVGVASVVSLGEQHRRVPGGQDRPRCGGADRGPGHRGRGALRGQSVDAERLQQAAHAAVQAASPIDDIRGTAAHRRAVVAPLVQRTLHYAVQMAQGSRLPFQMQRGLAVEAVF